MQQNDEHENIDTGVLFKPTHLWWYTRSQVRHWKDAGIAWLWGDLSTEVTDGNIIFVEDISGAGLPGYVSERYGCMLDGQPSSAALRIWRQVLQNTITQWCGRSSSHLVLIVTTPEKIAHISAELVKALAKVKPDEPEKVRLPIPKRSRSNPLPVALDANPYEAWRSTRTILCTNPLALRNIATLDPAILKKARRYWASFGLDAPWDKLEEGSDGQTIQ